MEADEYVKALKKQDEDLEDKIEKRKKQKRDYQEAVRLHEEKLWQKTMVVLINKAGGKCQECGYHHKISALEFYDDALIGLKENLKRAIRAKKRNDVGQLTDIYKNISAWRLICRGCVHDMKYPWI